MGDWTLRGTMTFPTGSVASDSLRLFMDGSQSVAEAVPEPFMMVLSASALGLAIARRRRPNNS